MPVVKSAVGLMFLNRLFEAHRVLAQEPSGYSKKRRTDGHDRHDPCPTGGIHVQFVGQIRPQPILQRLQSPQEPDRKNTRQGPQHDSNRHRSDQPVRATKTVTTPL